MPGLDGTGPRGTGPMTGGGWGLCSPGGFGRGLGFGRRFGLGRGYGFGGRMPYAGAGQWSGYGPPYGYPYAGGAPYAYGGGGPYAPQMTKEEELDLLKNQAQEARGQLEQIEARIKDLEAGE